MISSVKYFISLHLRQSERVRRMAVSILASVSGRGEFSTAMVPEKEEGNSGAVELLSSRSRRFDVCIFSKKKKNFGVSLVEKEKKRINT